MTTSDAPLELRPPRWARVWVVAFPLVTSIVVLLDLVPLQGDPGWPMRIFWCTFAAALGWRLFRLAAIGTPDGRLVVRNHWQDRTLHRDDVGEVEVARRGAGPNRSVRLELRDGSAVRLDVTEHFLGRPVDRAAAAVRHWLREPPAPDHHDTR